MFTLTFYRSQRYNSACCPYNFQVSNFYRKWSRDSFCSFQISCCKSSHSIYYLFQTKAIPTSSYYLTIHPGSLLVRHMSCFPSSFLQPLRYLLWSSQRYEILCHGSKFFKVCQSNTYTYTRKVLRPTCQLNNVLWPIYQMYQCLLLCRLRLFFYVFTSTFPWKGQINYRRRQDAQVKCNFTRYSRSNLVGRSMWWGGWVDCRGSFVYSCKLNQGNYQFQLFYPFRYFPRDFL